MMLTNSHLEIHLNGKVKLGCGNPQDIMKFIKDESIDCLVSHPQCDTGFMNGVDPRDTKLGAEVNRTLKPGARVVSFDPDDRLGCTITCALLDARLDWYHTIHWLQKPIITIAVDVKKVICGSSDAEQAKQSEPGENYTPLSSNIRLMRKRLLFPKVRKLKEGMVYPHELGVLNMDELIQHCQGRCTNFIYAAGDQADKGPRFERRITAPVFLLRWLVRLVTPKGGVVLDPFASTAATAEAALLEGCSSISIAPDVKYLSDIRQHILRLGSGD